MSYGTSPLATKWWEVYGEKEYDGKEPHEKSAEEYAGQYLYFHPENALELFQRDYAHLEEILFNEITDLIQKETENIKELRKASRAERFKQAFSKGNMLHKTVLTAKMIYI